MAAPAPIADVATPRLRLMGMTLASVLAAERGEEALARCLKLPCAPGCLDPSFVRVLTDLALGLASDAGLAAWNRWIVHAAEERVVGTIGFLARPDEHGSLELGYSIAPGEQNRGYATEATRGLVDFALAQPAVRVVVAMCREDNAASVRVLEKTGFRRVGEVGPMWAWELKRPAPADARRPADG